jgi:hypothetical protein
MTRIAQGGHPVCSRLKDSQHVGGFQRAVFGVNKQPVESNAGYNMETPNLALESKGERREVHSDDVGHKGRF